MEYEYVALSFGTSIPAQDREHIRQRSALRRQGWEAHLQAPWSQEGMPKHLAGGACIMRRPKDEPRKEKESGLADWERLYREYYGVDPPTCLYLLPPRLCPIACEGHQDEPRMWTKKEIKDIYYNTEKATVQRLVAKGLLRDRSNDDLKGEKMQYEYIALLYWTQLPKEDEDFTRRFGDHLGQGWKKYICAPWPKGAIHIGGACIMRRPLKEEKMKEKDSCAPERCIEEKECVRLDVFPIYNAYLKKTCYDSEQALRLTFIEMQYRLGRALTWPRK